MIPCALGLVLLLWASPAWATVLFFSGWETGDATTEWASGTGCTVTTNAKTGTYAGQASAANTTCTFATPAFTGITDAWARTHLMIVNSNADSGFVQFAGSGPSDLRLGVDSGRHLCWQFNSGTCVDAGTTVLATGVWYLVEFHGVVSATVGGAELWINGALEFSKLTTNTSALTTIVGTRFAHLTTPGNLPSWDNAMVCTTRCPLGQTIARQGIHGSPFYEGGTNVGCTNQSTDMYQCWSQTPFTTDSSITMGDPALARTMFVSPLSAIQTGHGPEFMRVNDTVNACKTTFVLKKSNTNALTASVRRRIASADTDTVCTVGLTDAGCNEATPWTTTFANLQNAQIGITKAASTGVTVTVEDGWLSCDYLPVGGGGTPPVEPPFAVLWFTGWESGSTEGLVNAGTANEANCQLGLNLANPAPFTGSWAASCSCGASAFFRLLSTFNPLGGTTVVYFRAQVQSTILAGHQGFKPVIRLQNALGAPALSLWQNTESTVFFAQHNSAILAATNVALDGTYHLIEMKAVIDPVVGGVELFVDGIFQFSSFVTDTSDLGTFTNFTLGPDGTCGLSGGGQSWDDLMFCKGGYCPRGGTVARQGTSGSPTYTAWTKTGCTSSLIENCWSQTPFNAASNASSSVALDAQTMRVNSFNVVDSPNHKGTITPRDTVNACKVSAIAKSGTASAPLNLRRRMLNVDTDVAKTLTVADAYYEDAPPWRISAIDLDSQIQEIGVVHGAGADLDTVEDMWLQCDRSVAGTAKNKARQSP